MSRGAAIALFCMWVLVLAAMPFVASNYFVKIATFLDRKSTRLNSSHT